MLDLGGQQRWAVEIKRGLTPKLGKGFHAARADLAPTSSFVVYSGTERYPLDASTQAIGVQELARTLAAMD